MRASSFDAFFDEANKPAVKSLLPVVTEEIGDGWLYSTECTVSMALWY